jgi:hypothetical protein
MSRPAEPPERRTKTPAGASSLVWTVWLALTLVAVFFVARYASRYPIADDLEMANAFGPHGSRPLAWWWSQHMEHRVPLPRLLYVTLVDLSGDVRSTMYAEVALLSGLAAAAILAARRIRGRSSWTDLFLPLLFLHTGNGENLLLGFCLSVTLPVVLGALAWMLLASGPEVPRTRTIAGAAACFFALPLCGGHGLVQVPALALALGWIAVTLARSGDRGIRRRGLLLGLAVGATLLVAGLYFVGFERPDVPHANPSLVDALLTSWQYLSLSIGPVAEETWPWSGIFVLATALLSIAVLARGWREEPGERVPTAALLAGFGAVSTMALAVGLARSFAWDSGWTMRYVVQPAPLLAAAYFVWVRREPSVASRVAEGALALVLAAALVPNARAGIENGRLRERFLAGFEHDAVRLSLPRLSARHWQDFYPDREGFESRMRMWLEAGFVELRDDPPHPSVNVAPSDDERDPAFMLEEPAISWRSEGPVVPRRVGDDWVVVVPAEGELRFAVPSGARELALGFGIHPWATRAEAKQRSDGVVFRCELETEGGGTRTLFERELDPVARAEDGGTQRATIALAGDERGVIVLRSANLPGRTTAHDAAYWSTVRFD